MIEGFTLSGVRKVFVDLGCGGVAAPKKSMFDENWIKSDMYTVISVSLV